MNLTGDCMVYSESEVKIFCFSCKHSSILFLKFIFFKFKTKFTCVRVTVIFFLWNIYILLWFVIRWFMTIMHAWKSLIVSFSRLFPPTCSWWKFGFGLELKCHKIWIIFIIFQHTCWLWDKKWLDFVNLILYEFFLSECGYWLHYYRSKFDKTNLIEELW